MANKKLKFKPTPAGILFLSAIAILLIAIIVLIVWAAKSCGDKCKKTDENDPSRNNPGYIASPDPDQQSGELNSPDPSVPITSADPNESPDPNTTPNPDETPDPNTTLDPNATPDPNAG